MQQRAGPSRTILTLAGTITGDELPTGHKGENMSQPDMNQLLQQAQQMQAQLQAAQQEILASTVKGTAGNDLVTVTMSGNGQVTDVTIDPQVVDPEDVDTLQDLIMGAFADAHKKVADLAEEKMGPLSQGFGDDAMGSLFQ